MKEIFFYLQRTIYSVVLRSPGKITSYHTFGLYLQTLEKNEIYSFFKSSHDERNGFFLGSETIKWMSRNMLSHDLADLQTFYPTQRVQHPLIETSRAIE
jgi:hypothetical protein